MLGVLKALNLKLFSLQSLIVLSICLYYFVGMQVSTVADIDPRFLTLYKITFIAAILSLFLVFFALHHRPITKSISTRIGISVLAVWLCLFAVIQQPSMIFMLIIVVTFYDKNYKRMMGYLFSWLALLFVVFVMLASYGVINSGEMLKYNLTIDSSEYETVTALGMGNPNTAMAYLLGIIMAGAYVFYESKYRKKYGIMMIIASLVVYASVGSRTGLVCAAIFLILYIFDVRKIRALLKAFTPFMMVILLTLSVVVGLRFGQTDNGVNDLLTTRPYQWGLRLEGGALTNLIGNSDKYITVVGNKSERYPLDNQFIYLLARSGWFAMIAVIGLYLVGSRKNKSPVVTYMIFTSIVQCFVESLMFTAIVNLGLLFILSSLLLANKEGEIA